MLRNVCPSPLLLEGTGSKLDAPQRPLAFLQSSRVSLCLPLHLPLGCHLQLTAAVT